MITQKGLKQEDVFVLFSEDGKEFSIFIGIPDCEKFSITKTYSSQDESYKMVSNDVDAFITSHKTTLFTLSIEHDFMTGEPVEEPVNDSWSSIYEDAKGDMKDKFKDATGSVKGKIKNRFNFL